MMSWMSGFQRKKVVILSWLESSSYAVQSKTLLSRHTIFLVNVTIFLA